MKTSQGSPPSESEATPEIPVEAIKVQSPVSDERANSTFGVIDNQMSDLSINERLYQSATSDLSCRDIKEDTMSTNGDYHENHGSLFNDLEAELIAQGIVKTEPVTPKSTMSIVSADQEESIRRESTPDIKASRPLNDKLEILFLKRDEEKRLKVEEELRENARRLEEERRNRNSMVESILSKVKQSS